MYDDTIKIIVFGDESVDKYKTAITQRFLTNLFVQDQTMTIGVDFEVKSLYVDVNCLRNEKGVDSNVRSKFIGAKKSQDIRGQVGMHFGVVPLDEGEEDPDFLKLIGGKITMKKSEDYYNDDDVYFPYPYIFKPPEPPDDFAMAPQVLIRAPLKEKEPEEEVNCQFCGMELTKEEQLTHSCKKKPE